MARKWVLFLVSAIVGCAIFAWAGPAFAANSPNFATNNHPTELYYDGYVQCQPSYLEAKSHAARGYIRYRIQGITDTGRLYTAGGYGPTDSRIYSRSYRFYDTWSDAPKTEFYYGFDWVPVGSAWPFSVVSVTE